MIAPSPFTVSCRRPQGPHLPHPHLLPSPQWIGVRASRDGKTSSGSPATRRLRAMKLPIEWPRRQQRADSMATANLGGFSHGQAWPTSRGGQSKPKRGKDKVAPILHSTAKKPGFRKELKGERRADRVEVLSAADRTCLDRTLP